MLCAPRRPAQPHSLLASPHQLSSSLRTCHSLWLSVPQSQPMQPISRRESAEHGAGGHRRIPRVRSGRRRSGRRATRRLRRPQQRPPPPQCSPQRTPPASRPLRGRSTSRRPLHCAATTWRSPATPARSPLPSSTPSPYACAQTDRHTCVRACLHVITPYFRCELLAAETWPVNSSV